jgi:hypothetical protein
MKTHSKLREKNFHSIRMIEVRQRPFDGRKTEFEIPDVGRKPNNKRVRTTENVKACCGNDDTEKEEGQAAVTESAASHAMCVARSINVMKGHTAFLTFAVCPVEVYHTEAPVEEDSDTGHL